MDHHQQQYSPAPETDLFTQEPVVYGSFGERLGAALIDGIILFVAQMAFAFFLLDSPVLARVISISIGWLYFALQESSPAQATLGKRAVGIKVTNIDGQRISFGQATGRYFGKIISSMILFIGYLMMLWDANKQTLHDKMAGTFVVKGKNN